MLKKNIWVLNHVFGDFWSSVLSLFLAGGFCFSQTPESFLYPLSIQSPLPETEP